MTERNAKSSHVGNIRTYVSGLISRGSFTAVRGPSGIELAEKFSVAGRTERTVLAGLIAKGCLIGRSCVGTFANPHCGFRISGVDQRYFKFVTANNRVGEQGG